jgi:hypothetical protein
MNFVDHHAQKRAKIRALNRVKPRCACCGNDLFISGESGRISSDDEFMLGAGYVVGDLVCYWCIYFEITSDPEAPCAGQA